jgi:hypothetical protein
MNKTRNFYYGDPKQIDLSKLRTDAIRYSAGDSRTEPAPTTIHFHRHGVRCFGREHEDYKNGELVQDVSER